MPHPLALMAASVMTADGLYWRRRVSVATARRLVKAAPALASHVGHAASAEKLSEMLGQKIEANRTSLHQKRGQKALVLKADSRLSEGAVLDRQQMEEVGYSLFLVTRIL